MSAEADRWMDQAMDAGGLGVVVTCELCDSPDCVGYACAYQARDAVGIEAQRYLDTQLSLANPTDEWECAECGWIGYAQQMAECATCPECEEGWSCWPDTPRHRTRL